MVDTIAAIATPAGKGGVAIIRVSGPKALSIAKAISHKQTLKPRYAIFSKFFDENNEIIDEGILLTFPSPHSFTGEDVIELQGHGGPVVMDLMLSRVLSLGARVARPGEFSERAFINDKLDLTQAEAIADLIDASSEQAARLATKSLQGEFARDIHSVVDDLIKLRMYVEAAIDFPEEEIDFLSEGHVGQALKTIIKNLKHLLESASQGALIREGINVVIIGEPNAGKSTLLNALSGKEAAIVTEVPGTTRDVMKEYINIDGIPLHLIDTAGIRETEDIVEKEGIRRAFKEVEQADCLIFIIDALQCPERLKEKNKILKQIPSSTPVITLLNKIDLVANKIDVKDAIPISAKLGEGISELKQRLKKIVGFKNEGGEGLFLARRRHLDCLNKALVILEAGQNQLHLHRAGELLAEDLRVSQQHLNEITGEFSADDLLGRIFSSFCIGK